MVHQYSYNFIWYVGMKSYLATANAHFCGLDCSFYGNSDFSDWCVLLEDYG